MKWGFLRALLLFVLLACSSWTWAQARHSSAAALASRQQVMSAPSPIEPGTAQGELAVTMTVVSSVGVMIDENGRPKVIIANAADPADNVSSVQIESTHPPQTSAGGATLLRPPR